MERKVEKFCTVTQKFKKAMQEILLILSPEILAP